MYKTKISIWSFALILCCSGNAFAKIADPPPVSDGAYTFSSHLNEVTAVDASQTQVWKTRVYASVEPEQVEVDLERDVQWNIITAIAVDAGVVRVKNSAGETFALDARSGSLILPEQPERSMTVGRMTGLVGLAYFVVLALVVGLLFWLLYRMRKVRR